MNPESIWVFEGPGRKGAVHGAEAQLHLSCQTERGVGERITFPADTKMSTC